MNKYIINKHFTNNHVLAFGDDGEGCPEYYVQNGQLLISGYDGMQVVDNKFELNSYRNVLCVYDHDYVG